MTGVVQEWLHTLRNQQLPTHGPHRRFETHQGCQLAVGKASGQYQPARRVGLAASMHAEFAATVLHAIDVHPGHQMAFAGLKALNQSTQSAQRANMAVQRAIDRTDHIRANVRRKPTQMVGV
ncbi:hypothetical protein SDC9_134795 [bioreactor metagenome]|uniref:Uncharacterized protein n=1 Tax=bioreactor metagenome TaxID=1076179 RepID=A0A645DEQ5_9ZZZZ